MFWMWNRMVLVSNFNQLSSPIFSSCLSCSLNCRFLFGFLCPPMWFYATILYFGNHYRKDPRERAGLGASAIAVISPLSLSSFCLSVCVCLLMHTLIYVNNVVHYKICCQLGLFWPEASTYYLAQLGSS